MNAVCRVLDDALELDEERFNIYVDGVRERLGDARPGTRVVTYHGLGAPFPAGYALERRESIGSASRIAG